MIDDKKIVEASEKYAKEMEETCKKLEKKYKSSTSLCNWVTVNPEAAFQDGINWFLKNLWHPASDKPNIKQGECYVTCLVKFKNKNTELCVYFSNPEGWVCNNMSPKDFKRNFKKWLYIDDLLPKEGDNHD